MEENKKTARNFREYSVYKAALDYATYVYQVTDKMPWFEKYTSVSGMDYTPDVRERLVLVPREDIIDAWKTDYEQMMGSMIYGEKPTWDELMQAMKELQERVRKCVNGLTV